MTRLLTVVALGFLIVIGPLASMAQDSEAPVREVSLWIGSHYTDFTDYQKKVGEFDKGDNELFPEFRINYLGIGTDNIFRFDGHYYDDKNIAGKLNTKVSDIFALNVEYSSFIHQLGQDLMENMETREYFPDTDTYGGKILTHDITDPDADYNVHRQEILSNLEVLLSHKNNVRLMVAHRTILEEGEEQGISNSHCFSCHMVSETVQISNRTHEIEAGIEADVKEHITVGYEFGYRRFESDAPVPYAHYDPTKHPVNGGAGAEFESRQNFSDESLPYTVLPETEKLANKIKVKGKLGGKSSFHTSLIYNIATNNNTDLKYDTWIGNASLATLLSTRTRMIVKVTGMRQRGDETFVDLPIFRDGRPGPATSRTDFDYLRYSTLDRADGRGSLELIHRLNTRTTFSGLLGYRRVDRYDYPLPEDGTTSNTLTAQAKIRYRKGMKFSGWAKYRFEKTSDPWVSGRGLFEARGADVLARDLTDSPNPFVFYWEREQLRYQDITTAPTDKQVIELHADLRPSMTTTINLGLKAMFDKNGDLDSLDVEHSKISPSIAINLMPNQQWAWSAGYTMNLGKSKGPVTIALFDG